METALKLFLFIYLAGLRFTIAKDLTVDASRSTVSGTIYPSLSQAVSALVNTGGTLIDSTNTITLLANTLTVSQTFPGKTIKGTGGQSLLIQYESTPDTITQSSDCDLLPKVVISSNKYLEINNVKNLTIVGLNIQYQGSTSYNRIYNSANVMFSRFCFNNSEPNYASPTASLPSNWYTQFYIDYNSNVTITNGVYLYDGFKMFSVYQSQVALLSSMVFVPLSTMHDKYSSAIQVYSDAATTNVNVFQTQISCPSTEVVMPFIFYVGYVNNVNISGFTVENCNFNGYATNAQALITISGVFNALLDDFTFNNVTFGNNTNQALVYLSGVKNMTVSNIQINELNLTAVFYELCALFSINDYAPDAWFYPMEMHFINLTFTNCHVVSYNRMINFYISNSLDYDLIQMQNISVSNLEVIWYSTFFNIIITAPTGNTILWYFPTIIFDNITFDGIAADLSNIFYFYYDKTYATCISCEEIYHIQISNVRLENISLYESEFLLSDGYLVAVSDLIASDLTLNSSSSLFLSDQVVSTFFLTNSQLMDITLSDHSGIAISNISTARDWKLEGCYNNDNTAIFAETRPFIIYNTTFTNVSAYSKSILFSSTNPMVIIQNNTFTQTTLNDSILFEVGRYLYFLEAKSYFIEWWNGGGTYYPLPGARGIHVFETVENSIFREHFDLQLLYNSIRENIEAYEPENAIFFLNVQDNLIDTLESIQNSGLILLKNFQTDNGTVLVKNNTFMSVSSDIDINLFAGTTIERLIAINNTLAETSFPGYLLSLSSSYVETLAIDSNHLTNTQQTGNFLVISQECGTILINNTVAVNNHAENPFAIISCDVINSQVEILNSRFENIIQNSTTGVLETLYVISITTKTKSKNGNSQISLKDNIFKNITVNGEEGFTTGIYDNSFIFILAIDSILSLESNAFDEISITPSGNIFTLSIPTIYFTDTAFSNFQFWDQNGAFNMLFYNLSITNCSFESNMGFDPDGVGLMKFMNPTPKNPSTILRVAINNCTFEKNIGPWGAILYTKNTPIELDMDSSHFLNNYVNSSGGLLEFYGISLSSVKASHCVFEATEGYLQDYPAFQVFAFQNPGENVNLTVKDSLMTLGDQIVGNFIQVTNLLQVNLNITNFTLTAAATTTTTTDTLNQFSMLVADNINAIFEDIKVSNVAMSQVGLFILNCDMARNLNYIWSLQIRNSSFTGLNLTQGLITINSAAYKHQALDNLTVWIQNTTFENIDWSSNAGGIVTSATSLIGKSQESEYAVTMTNCTFKNLKGTQGLIYGGVESEFSYILWLDNSNFDSFEVSSGGALINPTSSLLSSTSTINVFRSDISYKMTNSNFNNIAAQEGSIFYWRSLMRGVSILIENCSLENITTKQNGGVFSGSFEVSTAEQILQESNVVTIYLKNASAKNISAQNGAVIYSGITSQLLNLTLDNCYFVSISSTQNGGVLNMYASAVGASSTSTTSRILQSTSETTGNVTVTSSNFNEITAQNGAMIYDSTPNNSLSISLQGSIFQYLYAASRGGVLYLTEPFLSAQGNSFISCSADLSGEVIFSLSGGINLNDFNVSNTFVNTSSLPAFAPTNLLIEFIHINPAFPAMNLENYEDFSSNPIVPGLASYSLSAYIIKMTLIYSGEQGFEVVTDESSSVSLKMIFTNEKTNQSQMHLASNCVNSVCQATPSEIILAGDAGDLVRVDTTYTSEFYTQFQQFSIRLRGCIVGEINDTTTGECKVCGYGTYSVNINDTECNECPVGAICQGGNNILIKESFYRSEIETALFVIPCNDSNGTRCIGGYNNTCAEEYTGPICAQCNYENGYLTSGESSCAKCYERNLLIAAGTLLLLASLIYQIVMVVVTFNENKKSYIEAKENDKPEDLQPGAFMVILSTFAQISTIIANFDVGTVTSLLDISINIGDPNSQAIFSMQCLYYLAVPNAFQALQFQLIFYVFSPLMKLVGAIIFEVIRGLIWKDKEGLGKKKALIRIGAVAATLILLEQPGIIGVLCDYLNCTQLDPYVDEYWISAHNNIQCYTDDYYHFRNILVFPGLFFWGLLVPLIIFLFLRAKRKKLFNSQGFQIVFGNFYNGYQQEAYYWGIIIMNFKMIIFILDSVLTSSQIAKGLVFMCLFHLYFMVFKRKPPYNHIYLNKAEKYCSIAYMMILTLVFFRLTVEDSTVQVICNVLILLTVAWAGGYILINILWLHISKFIETIDNFKISRLTKKVLKETLQQLIAYHEENPKRLDDRGRRFAISLDLPPRLRNTLEYETNLRNAKRSKQLESLKRRSTKLFNKLRKGFTMSKGTKDDPKRKVILSQEIVSIKETSPISIHLGNLDISLKKKTPASPSSSSSSSSEENSQSFHSKNQEGQSSGQVSEIHELAGSRRSEMG